MSPTALKLIRLPPVSLMARQLSISCSAWPVVPAWIAEKTVDGLVASWLWRRSALIEAISAGVFSNHLDIGYTINSNGSCAGAVINEYFERDYERDLTKWSAVFAEVAGGSAAAAAEASASYAPLL